MMRQGAMRRIGARFADLGARGAKGFIPFVTAGYPTLAATGELVRELARRGADVIELGVPFSDPVADGPTIQRSSEEALAGGTTLAAILGLVGELRPEVATPLVLMTYCNPVYRYGWERFFRDAARGGVDGLIFADLPFEESEESRCLAAAVDLDLISLFAPTTSSERMAMMAGEARGFVYCVSLTGVTGARGSLPPQLAELLGRARAATGLPLAVGFGVSSPQQAGEVVAAGANAVIVGSAIVNILRENAACGPEEAVAKVGEFATAMLAGLGRKG